MLDIYQERNKTFRWEFVGFQFMICLTCVYPQRDGKKSGEKITERDGVYKRAECGPEDLAGIQGFGRTKGSQEQSRLVSNRDLTRKIRAGKIIALAALGCTLYAADPSTEGRTLLVQRKDIVSVATHLRYTTLIELPVEEQIIAENLGDKGFWDVQDNSRNLVFVKPLGTEPGRDTNLYITTASGNVYGLLLREVSKDPKVHADVKITLQQGDQDSVVAMKGAPKFVPASTVAALEAQVAEQQKELAKVKVSVKPEAIIHDYVWDRNSKAADRFGIRDISHDNVMTYIKAETQEAPSLYEYVDGKPTILQYTLKNGVYTVPKVLEAGELRMGKLKTAFHREKEQS